MFTIKKAFTFSAAHALKQLPDNHPCATLHGHNYKVILEFQLAKLTNEGFVIDYRQLDDFKNWIDTHLDHTNLNDFFGDLPTTCENMAFWMYNEFKSWWAELSAVTISETEKTEATYRPI